MQVELLASHVSADLRNLLLAAATVATTVSAIAATVAVAAAAVAVAVAVAPAPLSIVAGQLSDRLRGRTSLARAPSALRPAPAQVRARLRADVIRGSGKESILCSGIPLRLTLSADSQGRAWESP